jgi:hypothetical protein
MCRLHIFEIFHVFAIHHATTQKYNTIFFDQRSKVKRLLRRLVKR